MNKPLSNLKVYLAGPMENTDDNGLGWRKPLREWLRERGAIVYDPAERETLFFTQKLKDMRDDAAWNDIEYAMTPTCDHDLQDVAHSNIIVAYVDSQVNSTGTTAEIELARELKKEILLYCPGGLKTVPLWWFGRLKWTKFHKYMCNIQGAITDMGDISESNM